MPRNRIKALILAVLVPLTVYAQEATLERVSRLIASGQAAQAVQQCLEAQVEYPDSAPLIFALGCAQAAAAATFLEQFESDEAAKQLNQARDSFARAAAMDPDRFGAAGAYNGATCLLRLDATFVGPKSYDTRVENLQKAIAAFEACLKSYPEHEKARKNLDHARYTLNRLLQEPPSSKEQGEPEEEAPGTAAEVREATTELPNATAEVVGGSTVVLHLPDNGEEGG